MAEYFTGPPKVRDAFADQAATLYERYESVVVVGSIGRQAIYGHYEYDGAPPLPLVVPGVRWYESPLRDFDLVMPYGQTERYRVLNGTGRHPVDLRAGMVLNHPGGNRVGLEGSTLPVDPEVFRPYTRYVEMDGYSVPFRTFSAGTQYCIDGLARMPGQTGDKYTRAREQFARFASELRHDYPDEFLPPKMYEPFFLLNPEVAGLTWGDADSTDTVPRQTGELDEPARERIVVQPPETRQPGTVVSVGALLASVDEVRRCIGDSEGSALNGVLDSLAMLTTAMERLRVAQGGGQEYEGEEGPLTAVLASLTDAGEHAGIALRALQKAYSELGVYRSSIGGSPAPTSLGEQP